MNSDYKDLTAQGQIKDGDRVATTFKGKREFWSDVTVLKPNTDNEEILLDPKRNIYFITSLVLDDNSWAKNVQVMAL